MTRTTGPLTEAQAERLMLPFIQTIEYFPKFTKPVNLDGFHWQFETKKPITQIPDHHLGEVASFTMGWDNFYGRAYVTFNNNGDDTLCDGLKEFIAYISVK